jgi:hypothetical protein
MNSATDIALTIAEVYKAVADYTQSKYESDDVIAAIVAEARSIVMLPLPKEYLLAMSVSSSALTVSPTTGEITLPDDCLRVVDGSCGAWLISKILGSDDHLKPMDTAELATEGEPILKVIGSRAVVIPPVTSTYETVILQYIKTPVDCSKIPPALDDAVVYGAAARLATPLEMDIVNACTQKKLECLSLIIPKPKAG